MSTVSQAKSMFDAVWRNHGRRRVTIKLTTGTRTIPAGPKEGPAAGVFENIRVVRGRTEPGGFNSGGARGNTHSRPYQVLVQELPEGLKDKLGGDLCIIDTGASDDDPDGDHETDALRREVQDVEYAFDGEIAKLMCADPAR